MSLPVVRLDQVKPVALQWLWEPFIARGKVTLLEGLAGSGKSFVAIDLAARLSQQRVRTLFVNAEDDLGTTLRPRLDAAGANVDQVFAYGGLGRETIDLTADLADIETAITDLGIELLVIDPFAALLPGTITARNERKVRNVLAELAALAARTGVAVLIVRQIDRPTEEASIVGRMGAIAVSLLLNIRPDCEREVMVTRTTLSPLDWPKQVRFVPVGAMLRVEWPTLEELYPNTPTVQPVVSVESEPEVDPIQVVRKLGKAIAEYVRSSPAGLDTPVPRAWFDLLGGPGGSLTGTKSPALLSERD